MLGGESALDAADRWVDEWLEAVQRRSAAAVLLVQRVRGLQGAGRSAGGLVAVTVDAEGALTSLVLTEGVRRRPPEQTSADILSAIDDACADVLRQAGGAASATADEVPLTGEAMIQGLAEQLSERGTGGRVLTVVSGDGLIEARMRPSGRLVELLLDEEICDRPAERTAEQLLGLVQRVRAQRTQT